jgi:hypothetical protein
VNKGGAVLGRLEVSKGSVVWFPKGRKYGRKLAWADFGKLIEEHGKKGPEKR